MADTNPAVAPDATSARTGRGSRAGSRASSQPAAKQTFDEATLGQSESVFDAGVAFEPPAMAPMPDLTPPQPQQAPIQMSGRERRRRVRLQARRVRRIIRHIEPWSVLKLSIVFYACLWLILMLAGLLLWSFAERSGTLESIEDLVESLFALDPNEDFWSGRTIFRSYAIGGVVLSIAGVAFNVLLCVLYNLLSDLLGGIRISVIEEESARFRPPPRRRRG